MELLYITNNQEEYKIIEQAGVDIVFIDLEKLGKIERQGHLDTVISNHSIEDIKKIKLVKNKTKILVRIDPININSKFQIDEVVQAGADIIMLPMFISKNEVEKFVNYVDGRVEICLLLETSQALCRIDEILEVNGIDMIHIGLNDLHLSLKLDFMFECLSNGIVEYLVNKIKRKGIKFGIGGIARIGEGELTADIILKEHIRLGSEMVILSRSFKKNIENLEYEINKLRNAIEKYKNLSSNDLERNKIILREKVKEIRRKKENKNV